MMQQSQYKWIQPCRMLLRRLLCGISDTDNSQFLLMNILYDRNETKLKLSCMALWPDSLRQPLLVEFLEHYKVQVALLGELW